MKPKKNKKADRGTSVKIKTELVNTLKEIKKEKGVNISFFIESAIEEKLQKTT